LAGIWKTWDVGKAQLEGLRMSETAELTDQIPIGKAGEKSSEATWAAILSALILLLGLGVGISMYWGEIRAVSGTPQPSVADASLRSGPADGALLLQSDRWRFWVVIGTAGGVTGLLLAMVKRLGSRRRVWEKRVQAWEAEWRKTVDQLEWQLADSRKSEQQLQASRADIQRRADELTSANSQLRAELGQLKRAQLALAQQQQALESSKTVLQLHVETRTKDLQQLQGRYEHILNSAGEGICGLDSQGKATFANPAVAKLTGWKPEELLGKSEQQIFGRTGSEIWAALFGRTSGECVFQRKDGTRFPVEFVKTAIKENERVVGAVLVFKDITERKQVEEALTQKATELARSNAELEQFAFVASHDLQEPLRKIQAFGDRLKTKCEGAIAADAHDYLERMQSAATRMRTLINDLLAFSRAIRSAEPFVPVNLGVIAREVLGDLEVRIEKIGARMEVGDLPTIEADPMQMRQLLLNLIGNSLKFQPPDAAPVVKIQARILSSESATDTAFLSQLPATGQPAAALEQFCEISVQDNGIGFDEKYTDKIFAVFQRLHGRNEYEGTGVGLAVCRRIAERHHGTIIAKSKLGEGATFIVTLPVAQPKPPTPP
jgi:PAS domain S-box-containing protein